MTRDDPCAHRLMHCVDCKRLRKCKKCLQTAWSENPYWRQYLHFDADGKMLLSKDTAVELSLRHSPDYQRALETVYLSALEVSNERFRFDVQFFGGDSIYYNAAGQLHEDARNRSALMNTGRAGFTKAFATGAEMTVSLANSITWQFAGADRVEADSLINLNVVQPLLRGAGKKIMLENLTQKERDLLTNVRQMVFFRQGFYSKVLTGMYTTSAPSLTDPAFGVTTGSSGGYYKLLTDQIQIRNQEQNIVGLIDNLNRMTSYFEASKFTNSLQLELLRQNLYRAQSTLLGLKTRYETSVEDYVRNTIGLPPDIPVKVQDTFLDQFQLMSTNGKQLQVEAQNELLKLRDPKQPVAETTLARIVRLAERLQGELATIDNDYEYMLQRLPERKQYQLNLWERIRRDEARVEQLDTSIFDIDVLSQDVERIKTRIDEQHQGLGAIEVLLRFLEGIDRLELRGMIVEKKLPDEVLEALYLLQLQRLTDYHPKDELTIPSVGMESTSPAPGETTITPFSLETLSDPTQTANESADIPTSDSIPTLRVEVVQAGDPEPQPEFGNEEEFEAFALEEKCYRDWLRTIIDQMITQMSEASLCQARTRLNTIMLIPIDLRPEEALAVAEQSRLDWMSARARLVDIWRKIGVASNQLKSNLALRLESQAGTIENDGIKFDAKGSRVRVGMEWDSPLTRHIEQSAYRTALIEYQRARRTYYRYVDTVNADIRALLRNIETNQIDFEIKRAQIRVATNRVELAQLELLRFKESSKFDTNTARDIVDALDGLLSAQNELVRLWVDYETQRLALDIQMGTMQLDGSGRWVDPGTINSASVSALAAGQGHRTTPIGSNLLDHTPTPVLAPVVPPAPIVAPPAGMIPDQSIPETPVEIPPEKQPRPENGETKPVEENEPPTSNENTSTEKPDDDEQNVPPRANTLTPKQSSSIVLRDGFERSVPERKFLRLPNRPDTPDTFPGTLTHRKPLTAGDAPPPPEIP